MRVKVRNTSKHPLPAYETLSSAGMDIRANLESSLLLEPGQRVLVSTGLYIELPSGYEAQIRPRSGLAIKAGITVLNSPGTIDADYRGEVKIILINHSNESFEIKDGDRVCQMIVQKVEQAVWEEVLQLTKTDRGDGGFGHSGV
jgi:dUTP pyrophosphatase